MRKGLKGILAAVLGLVAVVSMTGCGPKHQGEPNPGVVKNEDGTYTVTVGSTVAVATYPTVFGPMKYGMDAYAWYYGEHENDGKVKINFINLEDNLVPATRLVNTQELLETRNAFGIVYGYDDQVNLVEQNDRVMVYTPMTQDYYQEAGSDSNALFPVQPIDYIEGQQLLLSAFASGENGLGATKVGIIVGQSQVGVDLLEGFEAEAAKINKTKNTDYFVQQVANAATTDVTPAVSSLKAAGVDVVVVADAAYIVTSVINAIVAANWDNMDVLCSYRLSNSVYLSYAYLSGLVTETRGFYTTGWIAAGPDNASTLDAWHHYVKVLTLYSKHMNDGLITTEAIEETKTGGAPATVKAIQDAYDWAADGISTYYFDSYAMAGYEGMYVFAEGLTRLYKDKLIEGASTTDYVKAMESSPIEIPMSTVLVQAKNGQRTGARAMTLVKCTAQNYTLGEPHRDFRDIPELEKLFK
jgi:hypothetical protein